MLRYGPGPVECAAAGCTAMFEIAVDAGLDDDRWCETIPPGWVLDDPGWLCPEHARAERQARLDVAMLLRGVHPSDAEWRRREEG